jgi:hypothetical protein
MNNKNSSQNRS